MSEKKEIDLQLGKRTNRYHQREDVITVEPIKYWRDGDDQAYIVNQFDPHSGSYYDSHLCVETAGVSILIPLDFFCKYQPPKEQIYR